MPISVNSLFFILFSSFIFLGALFSIVSKNMIYTLLSAIIVFLGVGGIFALLGAIYSCSAIIGICSCYTYFDSCIYNVYKTCYR